MVCFISFIMLLGTVGALECDAIDFKTGLIRCVIFLIIFGISSIRYWNIEDKRRLRRTITKFFN